MRILFIGNSHTFFHDMPRTFAEIVEAATGEMPEVTMLAYSGRSLKWHSEEYFAMRFNLMYGGYDRCVIQQQAHPFPGYEETAEGLSPIADICRESGTKPLLYMPWAEKRFPENQEKITAAFEKLGAEFGLPVAPVGLVWKEMLSSHPEVELFYEDGEHASPAGDYLIALVLAGSVLGTLDFEKPLGARNFANGMGSIDMEHLRLVERAEDTRITLRPETVAAIDGAARRVLGLR